MKDFKEFIAETVGAGGVAYERKVEAVVDRLGKDFPNFIKMPSKGGAFSNRGEGDMTFKINGKIINMEIKMNAMAQMGGTSIAFDRDADEDFDVFPNRAVDRLVFDKIREDDREIFQAALEPIMKHMEAYIDHIKTIEDPSFDTIGFPLSVSVKNWAKMRDMGAMKPLNKKIRLDAEFIRDHYQKKDVDYIQIGKLGLLHTGTDPLNLGVPMIAGEINVEMRLGAAGSGGKSYKSANYRVQGRLDLKTSGAKSNITLDNYESAVKGFGKYLKPLK